jgi:hypothetical protein
MTTQSNGLSWNQLFLTGSVVDIDAGRWYARTRIKPADLGIPDSEEVSKALALGNHRLAPPEAFEDIQGIVSRAKRALEARSLNFAMIKGARYVPSEQMEQLLAILRDLRSQHKAAKSRFIEAYAKVRADMEPIILQALRDATKEPTAVERAFQRIQAEYPTPGQIEDMFYFKWNVYAVQSSRSAQASEVAEEESESIKSVVKGMVEQLRGELVEKVGSLLDSAKKGGKLRTTSISSALTCLDRADSMNVLGDSELAKLTRALRNAIMNIDPEKDVSTGMLDELDGLKTELETGAAEAVAQAEQALMGLGVRKLVV